MEGIRVRVECYEGYRGAERPAAFHLHGEKIDVLIIRRSWIEEDYRHGQRMRCFQVSGSDWRTHTLCHDEATGEWLYLFSSGATSTDPSGP